MLAERVTSNDLRIGFNLTERAALDGHILSPMVPGSTTPRAHR